ncbi:MAG: hypothetical protein CMG00_06105 [Candidatus Marinimicrobia bacterium]|mgnify:CR=1 FL=1|nr:hypothetical protein [Candidatus Neomarinimicrobiota bacterium]|tara:strand:- start:209 stop:1369 length:1161 start_codon:yes stop_codon:yes gene_type:complete
MAESNKEKFKLYKDWRQMDQSTGKFRMNPYTSQEQRGLEQKHKQYQKDASLANQYMDFYKDKEWGGRIGSETVGDYISRIQKGGGASADSMAAYYDKERVIEQQQRENQALKQQSTSSQDIVKSNIEEGVDLFEDQEQKMKDEGRDPFRRLKDDTAYTTRLEATQKAGIESGYQTNIQNLARRNLFGIGSGGQEQFQALMMQAQKGTDIARMRSDTAQKLEEQALGQDKSRAEAMAKFSLGFSGSSLEHQMAKEANETTIEAAKINAEAQQKAAETQKPDGGGVSAVCTATYEQGLLPYNIWKADTDFGNKLPKQIVKGYHSFGVPIANLIRKFPLLAYVTLPFVNSWAYEMAYREGKHHKSNLLGKIIYNVGLPICKFIGKYIKD